MTSGIEHAQRLEIRRLNKLYSALSAINRAVVRTSSREELFRALCSVLVEEGGLRLAWIGWHDPTTHTLVPIAQAGEDHGYLKGVRISTVGGPHAQGPTGQAFAGNRAYVCNDLEADPAALPWRAEQERRGYRASAAFPIEESARVAGVLSVYAEQAGYFQDKEIELLTQAALDLSFALEKLLQGVERKRLAQIADREQRFASSLIESMPGIFYLYDEQGRFLRWNANFEAVSGYSGSEIARMHPTEFFPADERQRVGERIEQVFAAGQSSVESRLATKDGRLIDYFFTGKRIVLDGSACLVGVGVDIAERKRAEEALSKSEARYRSTLDNILEGCQLLDFDWRYLYLNQAASFQNRRPNHELLGQTMMDAWPGIEGTAVFALLRRAMEQRIGVHEETAFAFSDGYEGWFDVRAQPVPEGLFVLSVDITEQKRAELALRELNESLELKVAERTRDLVAATERAEAADRIKSAFLATMSHELRTPLNSIIGFTGIILQGLAGPLNAEQSKQLGMVQGSARHLLALINDVLDISKIEAGQLKVHLAPFQLPASIERTVASVRPMAEKKGLTLSIDIAPGLHSVTSDQRRVEQILLNLLNNAIKFSERGSIVLAAQLLPNDGQRDLVTSWPAVCIRVSDTGIGVKAEDLVKLFQPFHQLDVGLGRQREGTGLGLAICRRLATLLGGSISAESRWGVGSTFSVMFPIAPREVES